MVIFTRTYDLITWVLPITQNFPRSQRFVITQRLQSAILNFQELLIEAISRARFCPCRTIAGRRCGVEKGTLVPATELKMGLDQGRTISSCLCDGSGDWTAAGRLAKKSLTSRKACCEGLIQKQARVGARRFVGTKIETMRAVRTGTGTNPITSTTISVFEWFAPRHSDLHARNAVR